MEPEKKNIILELTFDFAVDIIRYTATLEEQRKFIVANQLLKSGTSIGANVKESQSAESKADFIHKLKVAAKEVEETEYWLLLCNHIEKAPNTDDLLEKLKSIKNVLSKIIITSRR
ncbi:MAG: four helix bundle protein [Bacteroidia bacterium]